MLSQQLEEAVLSERKGGDLRRLAEVMLGVFGSMSRALAKSKHLPKREVAAAEEARKSVYRFIKIWMHEAKIDKKDVDPARGTSVGEGGHAVRRYITALIEHVERAIQFAAVSEGKEALSKLRAADKAMFQVRSKLG